MRAGAACLLAAAALTGAVPAAGQDAPPAPAAPAAEAATRMQLRAAVRPRPYCVQLDRLGAARPAAERVLWRPVAGNLCAVAMVDYPNRMRTLGTGELAPLGITEAELWPLAEAQTVATLPQPQGLGPFDGGGMVAITELDYLPSLLLNQAGWRALAAAQGEILVAIPSEGMMIVARAAAIADLAGFRRATREAFDGAERQISDSVYRWTEQGWVVAED